VIFFIIFVQNKKQFTMGHKITLNEMMAYVDNFEGKFDVCHGCRGIELKGSMILSTYPNANQKRGDMICAECVSTRESNRKRKERNAVRKRALEQEKALLFEKFEKFENDFQIVATATLEWKRTDADQLDETIRQLRKKYHVGVDGDGVFRIIISKKEMSEGERKAHMSLIWQTEEYKNFEFPQNVNRIEFDEIAFHRLAFNLLLSPICQ